MFQRKWLTLQLLLPSRDFLLFLGEIIIRKYLVRALELNWHLLVEEKEKFQSKDRSDSAAFFVFAVGAAGRVSCRESGRQLFDRIEILITTAFEALLLQMPPSCSPGHLPAPSHLRGFSKLCPEFCASHLLSLQCHHVLFLICCLVLHVVYLYK